MIDDLIDLLVSGGLIALVTTPRTVVYALAAGVTAAVLCFFLCSWFTRQWNRSVHLTAGHYAWCGFAAVVTVLLSVAAIGTAHLKEAATLAVSTWNQGFEPGAPNAVRLWDAERAALEKAGVPQPKKDETNFGSYIDVASAAGAETAFSIFKEEHPLLHSLADVDMAPIVQRVSSDVREFFKVNPCLSSSTEYCKKYPFTSTTKILAAEINTAFEKAIPEFQQHANIAAVIIFVVVQAIPFTLSGVAAYRQINIQPQRGKRPSSIRPSNTAKSRPKVSSRYRR